MESDERNAMSRLEMIKRDPFEFPYREPSEIINLLKKRNLAIPDDEVEDAEFWVKTVGYYHLKGYLSCLKEPVQHKTYRSGTRFSDAVSILIWERRLRSILLEQIGKVELRLRAAIVETMGGEYGDGYLYNENFDPKLSMSTKRSGERETEWDAIERKMNRQLRNFFSEFEYPWIDNFKKKRPNQILPIWMFLETVSFGELVDFYLALNKEHRKNIAQQFANPDFTDGILLEDELRRIFLVLKEFRNLASHYQPFFDKEWLFPASTSDRKIFVNCLYFPNMNENRKKCSIYGVILILLFLAPSFQKGSNWPSEIEILFDEFPNSKTSGVSNEILGIPKGWKRRQPWATDLHNTESWPVARFNEPIDRKKKDAGKKGRTREYRKNRDIY